MTEYADADDYNEELTEEEQEEKLSAADAIIRAENDSIFARNQWENSQEFPETDGFLSLT